ncbi:MAG TPA: hypothetical protein VIH57_23515, partial [Bacteroidales bacterium]
VSKDSLIIWGTGIDENLGDRVSVTIIATGFQANSIPELHVVPKKESAPERIPLYDNSGSSQEFKVRDRTNSEGNKQRTIEFDLTEKKQVHTLSPEEDYTKYEVKVNPQKVNEPIENSVKTGRPKETGYTSTDEKSNIEQLESIPAYVRKNVKIDQKPKTDTTISKYSLSTDEDNNIRLRQNNSYLYDNVD